eukprot:scaffold11624_cov144-Skeletonema_marinoi.AAC.1
MEVLPSLLMEVRPLLTLPSTDEELLKLTSDKCLWEDEKFGPFAKKFADKDAFFESYAKAHKALSELGSKFENVE